MVSKHFIVLSTCFCLSAMAGTIKIQGAGSAKGAPENVSLSINVISICYEKSREAKDANASLANTLFTVMRSFATDEMDQVSASGGVTTLSTEVDYSVEPRKVICSQKWRATNTLKIRIHSIEAVADLQDKLLEAIDGAAPSKGVMRTYAELSSPSFGLSETSEVSLKANAERAAIDDAVRKFRVFKEHCGFQSGQLTSVEPLSHQFVPYYDKAAEAAGTTPIAPEALSYEASWNFTFTFEGGELCSKK